MCLWCSRARLSRSHVFDIDLKHSRVGFIPIPAGGAHTRYVEKHTHSALTMLRLIYADLQEHFKMKTSLPNQTVKASAYAQRESEITLIRSKSEASEEMFGIEGATSS